MTDALIERIALAILNSDRDRLGLRPRKSRADVPDSEGYVVNARAIMPDHHTKAIAKNLATELAKHGGKIVFEGEG